MSSATKPIIKCVIYLFLLWLALAAAVLLHEWTHGLLAWIFGYKPSPFAIDYGGWSLGNVLFASNINQAVNDYAVAFIGHPLQSAIIAIVPPVFINGGLTILSFSLLRKMFGTERINKAYMWFVYCFLIWNFGEFFSYTCLRAFSTHADVGIFLEYTGLSPWVIFAPGLYLSIYGFHLVLGYYRAGVMQRLQFSPILRQIIGVGSICLLTLLQLLRVLGNHFNPVVHFIAGVTLIAAPWLWWRYCRPESNDKPTGLIN